MTSKNEPEDKSFYKWGVFYFNPDDKDFFHSKKNPDLGVTINFAHPFARYFVVIMLLIILGPFLLIFLLHK
jgi:uncharacterized membrane protein